MILGVHHPAISVPDMARAIEFYCDKLGFEPVVDRLQCSCWSGRPRRAPLRVVASLP